MSGLTQRNININARFGKAPCGFSYITVGQNQALADPCVGRHGVQDAPATSRAAYSTMLAFGAKLGDSSSEPGDNVLQLGEPRLRSIMAMR